jgi:hypothetical protein
MGTSFEIIPSEIRCDFTSASDERSQIIFKGSSSPSISSEANIATIGGVTTEAI